MDSFLFLFHFFFQRSRTLELLEQDLIASPAPPPPLPPRPGLPGFAMSGAVATPFAGLTPQILASRQQQRIAAEKAEPPTSGGNAPVRRPSAPNLPPPRNTPSPVLLNSQRKFSLPTEPMVAGRGSVRQPAATPTSTLATPPTTAQATAAADYPPRRLVSPTAFLVELEQQTEAVRLLRESDSSV